MLGNISALTAGWLVTFSTWEGVRGVGVQLGGPLYTLDNPSHPS